MITTLFATSVIASSQPVDTFKHFLPDYLLATHPYDRRERVPQVLDRSNLGWEITQNHQVDRPFSSENELTWQGFGYDIAYDSNLKRATEDLAAEEQRQSDAKRSGTQLSRSVFPLDICDVTAIPRLSFVKTHFNDVVNPHKPIGRTFHIQIDAAGGHISVFGTKHLFSQDSNANLKFLTTLTRRMIAFGIGEVSTGETKLKYGDITIPGRRFKLYSNKMANWTKFAEEQRVQWRYLPETAEIQIAGRTPIQLHLGTRTYHIGDQKWVADAPVTIHNKEFYIEENAMATILNAL